MRRELFIHFAFLISFFIFISLFNGWLALIYWPFWVGGILGTLLPDIDHLIYSLYLKPQELTSQRVNSMLKRNQIRETLVFLFQTRSERTKLVLHTATFQLIFLVLTFWIVTSSGSLFGKGLVLAFALHLSIDQIVDLNETGGLANWFKTFPLWSPKDAREASIWWGAGILLVLLLGLMV